MSLHRLHNTTAIVYRQVQAVGAASSVKVTWNEVGRIKCTIQGLSSRQAFIAGAMRTENQYTLYTVPGVDLRPRDEVQVETYPSGQPIPGTAGAGSSAPITYIVDSGPIDQSGRNKVLEYTVTRKSTTSSN